MHIRLRMFLVTGLMVLLSLWAHAQNMGMVFSPEIEGSASAVDFRFGYQPEGNATAHRLIYSNDITDDWQLRAMVQSFQNDQNSFGFQYVRLEAMWQFLKEETAGWASALRFSLQVPDNSNTPYRVGLAWSGLVNLDADWQLRGNVLIKREFGADWEPGFFPGGRVQISRKMSHYLTLAVDFFAGYNNITDLGDFDSNAHQVGPVVFVTLSKQWNVNVGALFGVSSASPDVSYRVNIAYGF